MRCLFPALLGVKSNLLSLLDVTEYRVASSVSGRLNLLVASSSNMSFFGIAEI